MTRIEESLYKIFQDHRVVFWYDDEEKLREQYEREILYPLATDRISIDLDDGVLVNYNKFGKAVKEVKGLNDKKAKEKVRKFDWIDTTEIRE